MKEIKNIYSWKSILMVTIMMILCTFIILYVKWLPLCIFCGVVNCIGIKCWYDYFGNVIIKPKEKILYLIDKNGNKYNFINSRGKNFYVSRQKDYEINKFYSVLKSKDYIIKIIKISDKNFKLPKIKESYWSNWYCPYGNFPGLLPIVYLIFLEALSVIFSSNSMNFGFIIMACLALYLIIYDLIYKLKKKKSIDGEVDDSKLINSYNIFWNVIKLITISSIFIILSLLFISIKDIIGKLFLLPFLLCAICLFWKELSRIIGNYKLVELFDKLYILIFLMYWFGGLFVGIYASLINEEYEMILVAIPFVLVGIWVGYKVFLRKNSG